MSGVSLGEENLVLSCTSSVSLNLLRPTPIATRSCPLNSVAEALLVLGTVRRFTIVMEASETSAAAVSISASRGEDVIVEGSGVGLNLSYEGRL